MLCHIRWYRALIDDGLIDVVLKVKGKVIEYTGIIGTVSIRRIYSINKCTFVSNDGI